MNHTYPLECGRARGEAQIPPDEQPKQIIGAYCDYSARLTCREHWFRLVWRSNYWIYITECLEPIGVGTSRRLQSKEGDVWAGELVCTHDAGKPVDSIGLVVATDEDLISLKWNRHCDGHFSINLPDGSSVVLPKPDGEFKP